MLLFIVLYFATLSHRKSVVYQANQRTEEVRSLKMRLRFREEGIKRLEAINSGKLSAETHFLQEREELLKEIEVLRNQVDRNPEVTRFAMENLQLKEELRRCDLYSTFCSFLLDGKIITPSKSLMVAILVCLNWQITSVC